MSDAPGDADRSGSVGFIWPPRTAVDRETGVPGERRAEASRAANQAAAADRQTHGPGALELLERRLFGAPAPVLRDGWRPEPLGDACPRCAGSVGEGEVDAEGCAACRGKRLRWDRAVRLGGYRGELRDAIMACKYRGDRRAGEQLGRALGRRVSGVLGSTSTGSAPPIVVPVPATLRRRFANDGIDHARLLARGVALEVGVSVTGLLRRRVDGRQARASGAAARARNVRGAFIRRSWMPPPESGVVVLVDDVRTTGATAASCICCLVELFPKPPAFLLATAAVSDRRKGRIGVQGAGEGAGGAAERKT